MTFETWDQENNDNEDNDNQDNDNEDNNNEDKNNKDNDNEDNEKWQKDKDQKESLLLWRQGSFAHLRCFYSAFWRTVETVTKKTSDTTNTTKTTPSPPCEGIAVWKRYWNSEHFQIVWILLVPLFLIIITAWYLPMTNAV